MIVYSDTTHDLKVVYNVHESDGLYFVTLDSAATAEIEALIVYEGTLDECVEYINIKIKE